MVCYTQRETLNGGEVGLASNIIIPTLSNAVQQFEVLTRNEQPNFTHVTDEPRGDPVDLGGGIGVSHSKIDISCNCGNTEKEK